MKANSMTSRIRTPVSLMLMTSLSITTSSVTKAANLQAGAAKVDITRPDSELVECPLHSRALVIKSDSTTVVLVTMDVVSLGKIGHIKDDFLGTCRTSIRWKS